MTEMLNKDYTKFSKEPVEDVEVVADETKHGVVVDCLKLNVRKEPDIESDALCQITASTDLVVYENESTEDFYKICTSAGIEGFCMKKFIKIMP